MWEAVNRGTNMMLCFDTFLGSAMVQGYATEVCMKNKDVKWFEHGTFRLYIEITTTKNMYFACCVSLL